MDPKIKPGDGGSPSEGALWGPRSFMSPKQGTAACLAFPVITGCSLAGATRFELATSGVTGLRPYYPHSVRIPSNKLVSSFPLNWSGRFRGAFFISHDIF